MKPPGKAGALTLAAVPTRTGCGAEALAAPSVTVSNTVYADGSHSGIGIGFSGPMQVPVTVAEGEISGITVDAHQDGHIRTDRIAICHGTAPIPDDM